MLDVHPPHEKIHGWRDFFIHLTTITVGLFIALSLEGAVEWQHHRHLVHEAEASLHTEIQHNADSIQHAINDLHKQQAALRQDVVVLKYIEKNKKAPEKSTIDISFHITGLANVSWQTAQSTGALSYMPYATAQEYADIYNTQSLLDAAQQQGARDAIVSLGPFADMGDDSSSRPVSDPTGGQAGAIREKIDILQGQLLLVDSLLQSLDGQYRKFLASRPR